MDAVLLDEDEISILFSFTRSYFHVESQHPCDLVSFLKSIMPLKRDAELYISIGYNKHGKTELFRGLLRHLSCMGDKFTSARGEKGMVMLVVTLPSYDMVFKVIRDRFGESKNTSRQKVMERYGLVFHPTGRVDWWMPRSSSIYVLSEAVSTRNACKSSWKERRAAFKWKGIGYPSASFIPSAG